MEKTTDALNAASGAVSADPPRPRCRARWRRRALVCLGVLVVLWLARFRLLTAAGAFLIVSDRLEPADAIVVLSGEPDVRAHYAADLYKQGYAKKLLCSGSYVPHYLKSLGIKLTEPEISAKVLRDYGAPAEDIVVITTTGQSTWEEAEEARRQADKRGWRSLIVVTSKPHTRRTRLSFRHAFKGADVRIIMAPTPYDGFRADRWWRNEHDLVEVQNEYIKLALYCVYCVKY